MSFMAKIAAGAATFALASGGLGMAGTLSASAKTTQSASAKTPSCTGCADWYTEKFQIAYVLDDLYGQASAGNPLILFQISNSDPAEDFVTTPLGTVDSLYGHDGHHGHRNSPGWDISRGFDTAYGDNEAIEIRYEPLGLDSGFCIGTWPGETAQPGFKIRLETCGEINTLFATEYHRTGNTYAGNAPTTLVTGTDTNFSTPLVLNYPAGNPTDMPRPWLTVEPEYTDNSVVSDSQLWARLIP